MKLVTWNVNSLGARLPRVLEFLGTHGPDIALLQETKCSDDAFPTDTLRDVGYDSVAHGSRQWAGVAILARTGLGLGDPQRGLPGERQAGEARYVEASVGDLRVASTYVTNGRAVGTEWFDEKLAFLDALAIRAGERRGTPFIVGGDFNVTRDDRDVYDPVAFANETHVTPDERSRLETILEAGHLVDAYRAAHPDDVQFTWWDYRAGHFHKGLGLRIDYVLLASELAGSLSACGIERDFRKGQKPSDHAPLVAEF